MKYIYRTLYIVITFLLLSSCQSNDVLLEEQVQVDMFFTASLPKELQTRSYGDGNQVDILYLGVFDADGKEIMRKTSPIEGTTIDFSISLTKNKTYNIVFWAQHEACDLYDINNMTSIKMDINKMPTGFDNIEKMDAFYATCKGVTAYQSTMHKVELVRPLAQVNIGTSGQAADNAEFKIIGAPTSFNPFTQEVSGAENMSFAYNTIPNKTFTVETTDYNYLAIAYLFASNKAENFSCELKLMGVNKGVFDNVSFQSNKRTNIIVRVYPNE